MTRKNQAQTNLNALKYLANSIIHEGQNPLFKIKSTCQTLINNLDEMKESVYSIYDSSARSLLAMDIALQNTNIEEIDKSKFVDLSIAEVVGNAVEKYLFNNSKEIELLNINYENDFVFKGDEVLMSFVILNLLRNALCYQAKINIWFDGDRRCLYFKDDGVGIPADKLPHIFDDFFTSDKKGGTGLGLPFCRRVMRAFGGDIFVKSEVGKGTEFCLRFE